jgi:ABC-type lipoprotein release transport system permease subunit
MLGVAVTSAILTGALLVGDSVRGSLRDLTLERLGEIEFSLNSTSFFRESLASEIASQGNAETVPAVILQGSVVHADSSRRTSNVTILGVDPRFVALFPDSLNDPLLGIESIAGQRVQRTVAINETLLNDLKAEIGDSILLSFDKKTAVNPEFILGNRDSFDLQETLRLKIAQIVPDRSFGRFSLNPNQATPYNVFLPLTVVQEAISREGKANTLLVSAGLPHLMISGCNGGRVQAIPF